MRPQIDERNRGYVNADGSPRPFPWWYALMIVGIATVFVPALFAGWVDRLFFRRADIQRWSVLLNVALLQMLRAVVGWAIWTFAWTWLAWVLVPLLLWRIWQTASVWWALLEADPARAFS